MAHPILSYIEDADILNGVSHTVRGIIGNRLVSNMPDVSTRRNIYRRELYMCYLHIFRCFFSGRRGFIKFFSCSGSHFLCGPATLAGRWLPGC